jgi:hypothetical protein
MDDSSLFLQLSDRNISSEIFFNSLLSEEDLSILLCTCRSLKKMILKWKRVFPIKEFTTKKTMSENMLGNMIKHYSQNIIKLNFNFDSILLTVDGYNHLAFLHTNLLELDINKCSGYGLNVISTSLINLKSLKFQRSWSLSHEDLDSISKLTNLEKIDLDNLYNLDDIAVFNFSTLRMIESLRVAWCPLISGLGLRGIFLSNKELLVQLELCDCGGISSEGYHCLTILTNLTKLTIRASRLDDIGLNLICIRCVRLEFLEMKWNSGITINGLDNIHCLVHLGSLCLRVASEDWLTKLFHNSALTYLDLDYSVISSEGLYLINSVLSNLTVVNCKEEEWNLEEI